MTLIQPHYYDYLLIQPYYYDVCGSSNCVTMQYTWFKTSQNEGTFTFHVLITHVILLEKRKRLYVYIYIYLSLYICMCLYVFVWACTNRRHYRTEMFI